MGLEERGKMIGEGSAVKAARQAGVAGEADTHESGRSRVAVLVLLALSFALGCTEFTIIGIEPDIATSLGVELSLVGNLVGYFAAAHAVCAPLLAVCVQTVLLALLFFTTGSLVPGLINVLLLGVGMYVVNSPGQMHFLNIAQRDYPRALTMAASVQPMSFNIGIAAGSFVGGVVVAGPGLASVGFAGAFMCLLGAAFAWLAAHLKGRAKKRV